MSASSLLPVFVCLELPNYSSSLSPFTSICQTHASPRPFVSTSTRQTGGRRPTCHPIPAAFQNRHGAPAIQALAAGLMSSPGWGRSGSPLPPQVNGQCVSGIRGPWGGGVKEASSACCVEMSFPLPPDCAWLPLQAPSCSSCRWFCLTPAAHLCPQMSSSPD